MTQSGHSQRVIMPSRQHPWRMTRLRRAHWRASSYAAASAFVAGLLLHKMKGLKDLRAQDPIAWPATPRRQVRTTIVGCDYSDEHNHRRASKRSWTPWMQSVSEDMLYPSRHDQRKEKQ